MGCHRKIAKILREIRGLITDRLSGSIVLYLFDLKELSA